MAENDRHLRAVQDIARGITSDEEGIERRTREATVKLREAARDLREFTDDLEKEIDELAARRNDPTATLELSESELVDLIDVLNSVPFRKFGAATDRAYGKLQQALKLESQPGGKFHNGPAA